MAFPESRLQRGYVQVETTWGTIPHSSGTATVAGGDAFLFTDLEMNYARSINDRPDKTGSLGRVQGTPGRKSATWRMRCSLAGSGAAGTAPDIDPFLRAAFGKAGVVSAGVSVTYGLEDAAPSLTIWDFNALAGASQRVAMGCIVQRMTLEWGQDFAFVDFSGEAKHVLDSDQFATADTVARSGLTTFPAEPASPSVNGTSVPGYKGTITLDGVTYNTFRGGQIELAVERELPKDQWNSDYPADPSNGVRNVTLSRLSMRDSDAADFKALKVKAHNGTTVDMAFAIGTIAGNIWTSSLNDVLLATPAYDYSATQRVVNFDGSRAHMTGLTSKDELVLVAA